MFKLGKGSVIDHDRRTTAVEGASILNRPFILFGLVSLDAARHTRWSGGISCFMDAREVSWKVE